MATHTSTSDFHSASRYLAIGSRNQVNAAETDDTGYLIKLFLGLNHGEIKLKDLDSMVRKPLDAVILRRALLKAQCSEKVRSEDLLNELPFRHYDFADVVGRCCENIIGYMPVPVGIAGPIRVDGEDFFLPMATTEGALVASVARGCKAINLSDGAQTIITSEGITRAPCLRFPSIMRAFEAKAWLENPEKRQILQTAFAECSKYCCLTSISATVVGSCLYPRFVASSGDAMGMNMITKCVRHAILKMAALDFEDLELVSITGNLCSDKKAAAINWIEGRGKSVVAQCRVTAEAMRNVLKTDASQLVGLNTAKNLVGSAVAGSLGGFNAHASNVVTAIFLATGQDVAQNVESSQCITTMEQVADDLIISVTMPSIEVGTMGGGTELKPQGSMLDLLGVRGSSGGIPGNNARLLARIVSAAVLAGELSLCSALTSDHLVSSHMRLNRKP